MLGYKISGFFYFSLPLFLFVVFPILAHAKCAITFKDGKKSESEYCEMVGNKFIYYKYGSEIEIDSSKVDHFEFAPDESINNIADDAKVSNGNNSNIDIIEKIKNKYGVDYGRSSFIR